MISLLNSRQMSPRFSQKLAIQRIEGNPFLPFILSWNMLDPAEVQNRQCLALLCIKKGFWTLYSFLTTTGYSHTSLLSFFACLCYVSSGKCVINHSMQKKKKHKFKLKREIRKHPWTKICFQYNVSSNTATQSLIN